MQTSLIMIVFLRHENYFWLVCCKGGKNGAFSDGDLKKKRSDVELSITARSFGEYCDDSFGKCLVFENTERTACLIRYTRL